MRISDWSSDVCSSDLRQRVGAAGEGDGIGSRRAVAAEPSFDGAAIDDRYVRAGNDPGATRTDRSAASAALAAATAAAARAVDGQGTAFDGDARAAVSAIPGMVGVTARAAVAARADAASSKTAAHARD